MEFKFILGIDISKENFNYCLRSASFDIIWEGAVDNHPDAIFNFISELMEQTEISAIEDIILIMEHTGIYVQHLANCWLSKSGRMCIVAATKVSLLLDGLIGQGEKTDAIDARRLAEYGIRYSDKLELWQAKDHTLEQLQSIHRQRSRLKQVIHILHVPYKESITFDSVEISANMEDNQLESMKALKNDLKKVEKQLEDLIKNDSVLNSLFKRITSVDGVGQVTAREIIIATDAFKKFTPHQAKSFARYAGVVPLKKESGKMKRKARTSKMTNRKIKTVMTMGATSLIGTLSDLGLFYDRKINEGKAHFSVINAMRNKMILRIFAVVRNQVMYDKNLNFI